MVRKTKAKDVTKKTTKKATTNKVEKGLLDEVKEKVEEGVDVVKETLHDGEELFADEIKEVKSVAQKGKKKLEEGYASVRDNLEKKFKKTHVQEHTEHAVSWIEEHWQEVIGVILVAVSLYMLWELALGLLIMIVGALLISGYFKK